jgi:hypothetical protein
VVVKGGESGQFLSAFRAASGERFSENMQRSRDMTLRSLGLRKAILFSSLAVLLAFAVYRAAWDVPSPIKTPNTAAGVAVAEN